MLEPRFGPPRRSALVSLAAFALLAGSLAVAQNRAVTVNGVPLGDATLTALESAYQTRLPDGRYWYDPVSGLWGVVGGPSTGQILPGLDFGAPLPADASIGTGPRTGVFVNGRELHPLEVAALWRAFGSVFPGRYWLAPSGIGGVEGGPPLFDLRAAAPGNGGASGAGYLDRGAFGSMGSDGNCFYYNDPGTGSSYMPAGC